MRAKGAAMAERALIEALRARAAGGVEEAAGPRAADLTLRLARSGDLPALAAELTGPRAMALATVVATDETATPEGDFKVRYLFEPTVAGGADRFVTLLVSVDPAHPEVPSLTRAIPAANWHEREMRDLFGIVPAGHPDPRPLVVHDGWPAGCFPLRKSFDPAQRLPVVPAPEFPHLVAEGEGLFEIPVGPIHAGIIEPGHFRFGGVGELVLHLEARLFYTHRGIEKAAEGRSPTEVLALAERICGACSLSHQVAYCEAIEALAGVRTSRRAQLIRSTLLELERLYNHVGDIANLCAGASLQLGVHQGGVLKERLQELNAKVAGHRYLFGVATPGGVRRDIGPDDQRIVRSELAAIEAQLRGYLRALVESESFMDRLTGTGVLSRSVAEELGAVGVAARASGVRRDVRAERSYSAYPGDLEPVVRSEGDVRARMLVRADEAIASFGLVRGFLDELAQLPSGDLAAPVGALAADSWAVGIVESPRGENVHWVMTGPAGEIRRYRVRSASYNWALVPYAVTGDLLPDFPLINKSFELCYACLDR
ncbi:MAG TPA: NADH-quinone oxidoreductase subunit C [bacterium]